MKRGKINLKKALVFVIAFVLIICIVSIVNKSGKNNENEDILNTNNIVNEIKAEVPEVILNNEKKKELNKNTIGTLENGLPILMYHFFYSEKDGEKGPDSNWMEISNFEMQMKYLSENNYYFPSWEEISDYLDGKIDLPAKSVVVSVDDGDVSFFKLAVPILQKYNIIATSFVVTSWSGDSIATYKSSPNIKFESHSNDMHKAGKDGKGYFLTATKEEATEDLNQTKAILGTNNVFCYPFGDCNDFTKQILAQEGYKMAVTTKNGKAKPGMDKFALPRVRMSQGDSLESFTNKLIEE